MRGYGIMGFLLGSIPFILKYPYVGAIMWYVVSFMNIQQDPYAGLGSMPVGLMIAGATLIGMIMSPEPKKLPMNAIVLLIILWAAWLTLTTIFAYRPAVSWPYWNATIKMLLMTLVVIMLINNRQRLHALIWAAVICIGVFGFRGGLFTVLTGGGGVVEGPPNTMISDNNELATALIMILPMARYLHLQSDNRWIRYLLVITMVLVTISVFGSFSRGALVGSVAMLLWLLRNSRNRLSILALAVIGGGIVLSVMPKSWFDRMATLQNGAAGDDSVIGRYDSYEFAYRQALDSIFGGGFHVYVDAPHFMHLVPNALIARAIHSIYFEALGEHGFIGLGIFVLLIFFTFAKAAQIRGMTRGRPELVWAFDLASMLQVSLIGYAVAGAALPMTFFDLFYGIAGMLVCLENMIEPVRKTSRQVKWEKRTGWAAVPKVHLAHDDVPAPPR